ncbi:MAG TPA: hypothetical protein VN280_22350 [Variovorax sp.]|nr:hypothetical protein [Variovorax sp.]
MAVYLVSCELTHLNYDYQPLQEYLSSFSHCKSSNAVWLLDTGKTVEEIRDDLNGLLGPNDGVLVSKLEGTWASSSFPCGAWLNSPGRFF